MSKLHIPFHIQRHDMNLRKPDTDVGTQKLQHTLLLTWLFISQEGLLDEAVDFLREHENSPLTVV